MWEQFHPIPQKASPSPSKGGKTTSPLSPLQPHPRPLSEWNNPTQPPPRGGVPNGSRLGKGILNTKRAFLHIEETPLYCKETPSSNWEGRFLNFKIQLPLSPLTTLFHPTNSVHSPLHSERGWGWGFSLSANNSFHAPLHSERGRGWGWLWLGGGFLFDWRRAFRMKWTTLNCIRDTIQK